MRNFPNLIHNVCNGHGREYGNVYGCDLEFGSGTSQSSGVTPGNGRGNGFGEGYICGNSFNTYPQELIQYWKNK